MIISGRYEALRERATLLAEMFSLLLQREALLLRPNYSPDQPRTPAGQPGGGRWAREGGGDGSGLTLAGGFDDDDLGKTVQNFMSEKCKRRISHEIPGQFLDSDLSIREIIALKRRGDQAANTCIKLLNQYRFRK